MAELFLPTLHTFAMNNIFTGSKGLFRFRAEPKVVMANPKEVDFAQSAIHVEYWHGLYCYEKSTMEGECTFPMSEEGREEMCRWLEEKPLRNRQPPVPQVFGFPDRQFDFFRETARKSGK